MNSRSFRSVRLVLLGIGFAFVLAACGGATTPSMYTLTVATAGTGSGAVTSTPSGIDTSVASGGDAEFADGTTVTLTATAAAGSSLTGWGGACAAAAGATCDVTMDAAKSASATFDLITGSLDLNITGVPFGATPSIQITGPNGYDETFTTNASVPLAPGSYTVAPAPVSDGPAIYRARQQAVAVVADATANVSVTYEQPVVLFYYDSLGVADDNVAPALTANGFDVTQTGTAATFDTGVAGGTFDLVIAMAQGGPPTIDESALATFIDGGGRAIGADYSGSATFAAIFDAVPTASTNLTTADLASSSLSQGITNPIALENPTYGIFSRGLTATTDGASLCTFENDDSCLVSGNSGRSAMLGFLMDTVPGSDDQALWENLTLFVLGY